MTTESPTNVAWQSVHPRRPHIPDMERPCQVSLFCSIFSSFQHRRPGRSVAFSAAGTRWPAVDIASFSSKTCLGLWASCLRNLVTTSFGRPRACPDVKPVREPGAGNLHARFDERGGETAMDFSASAATKDAARIRRRRFCTPPRFFSTLPDKLAIYFRVASRASFLPLQALN